MKKILRSIQTLFPYLHDVRFGLKFYFMKLRNTPHEYDFNAIKLFKPNANQSYIDIGSNRGEAILSMLIMTKVKTNVIGFEPNPIVYKKLKKYFIKNENIVVHNTGLGNENGELTLHIPFYRKWMFDGLASYKLEEAKDWLKGRLWLYDASKLTIKKLKCQIQKLDDFQLNPYFIKIDVQGYEYEVLKGGIDTIKAHLPIILIESIKKEHISFLEQFGYEFYSFNNGNFFKGYVKLNNFCIVRRKHIELNPYLK